MEETYGALNERQLGISESTCSGVFGAAPRGMDHPGYGAGRACLSIDALSQIAMERHSRARDAIGEMGRLAVRYGFYGAGLFEGTAESLMVTDVAEAWVFHILPDPDGSSAIWAARRVPDDSFAVVPNAFIIREIDADDATNYMWSDSAFDVAEKLGWWSSSSGKKLDFTATYSDGEYSHKYYSGRRSWGVYRKFAPSLDLSAEYEEWRISDPYPFAARPDAKLCVEDVAMVMRSYYEDTPYSQAGNSSSKLNLLAGGPWKSPDHVAGDNSTPGIVGNWERTVGLYRTSDSYIAQSRSYLPDAAGGILWYGPYAAPYASYVPFAGGMTSLPRSATSGHHMRLDKTTLFWANRYVGNYARLKWIDTMREVKAFQGRMMGEFLELQSDVDALVVAALHRHRDISDPDYDSVSYERAVADAVDLYSDNAERTVSLTWDLADHLMFKYADGQIHSTPESPLGTHTPPRAYDARGSTVREAEVIDQPGYPNEWLEKVGYKDGPPPPPNCEELEWRCGHADDDNNNNNEPHRTRTQQAQDDETEGGNLRGGGDEEGTINEEMAEEEDGDDDNKGGADDDDNDDDDDEETTMMGEAWREYLAKKREAYEGGRSACKSRGDVAAALLSGGGRKECAAAAPDNNGNDDDDDDDDDDDPVKEDRKFVQDREDGTTDGVSAK